MRRSRTPLRIHSLLTALLAFAALFPFAPVFAGPELRWDPTQRPLTQTLQAPRPTSLSTEFTLFNDTDIASTYTISFPDLPGGWSARTGSGNTVTIANRASVKLAIRIDIPDTATPGRRTITIRATRNVPGPSITEDAFLDLTLVAQTPPPTAEGVCPEPKDPGGDLDSAALIRVDKEEPHGICTNGDEDWFKFGALAGKYYTIDISVMDKGLDLAIELYDEDGRLLDANDDFPRTDEPSQDNARPRIKSFRAPATGFYYIRVRDTLGIGGANLGYRIVVMGEGYGRNPPPVSSICNDIYEPDGLPEQAYTINPNETHKDHRLCPRGDADWIKFFALSGYTYYLYTESKDKEGKPIPGADPVLFLFNRDGQTLIDANNNIPGGTTLDAAVSFRPAADGIYYAQIKNVGDIGDTNIAYNVTLKACPAEQPACGPPADVIPPPPPVSSQPPPVAAQPPQAPVAPPQFLDSEAPPERGEFSVDPATLGTIVTIKPTSVIDPAFEQLWQRADLPIAGGRVIRGWLWGPAARLTRAEAYTEGNGRVRQVLYFDKGRMELTKPEADRRGRWYISSGLLSQELISGKMQIGDADYTQRGPADIAIVGDLDDARAPTYASLTNLTARVDNRVGQLPVELLARDGQTSNYAGNARPETRLARYIGETGHNVPAVFWDYFNARGLIYERGAFRSGQLIDWVATIGYPISEPYWTRVRVAGVERDVLVQAFERRILTYAPDEPAGWRIQLGNVGRHYYRWRYGEDLPN